MLKNYAEQCIQQAIQQAGGALPFDQFMELALYAPNYGYYVGGRQKFGAAGDFVTAPEISPLFSRCLANQCAQALDVLSGGDILEFGAGSGRMAADILLHLQSIDALPERYCILDLSADLQADQQHRLQQAVPHLMSRITWIRQLPDAGWRGVVLANEVLDAMPVHRFQWTGEAWRESFVRDSATGLLECWQPINSPGLLSALQQLVGRIGELPVGYQSEINLRMSAWLAAIAEFLAQGLLLLIDYGYAEREYYHPERSQGTLVCHHQHQASSNPFMRIGEQDITANVDFTALAHAALDNDFELAGYTNQMYFLLDNGLDQLVGMGDMASLDQVNQLQAVKQLTLPSEMGERFKVMALQRRMDIRLNGFRSHDLRAYL